MTKQEKQNEKRLDKAVVASSMTLSAQLKAINHEAGLKLQVKDNKGNVTLAQVTKRQQLSKLGMEPKLDKNGKPMGYTPATFAAGVNETLKEVIGGQTTYSVYVDRVVTVTMSDNQTGSKDYSLYTAEEADKKVKGESAQTIKLYRKVLIDPNGWVPGLIVKVLRQSREIAEHEEKAKKSQEAFDKAKEQGLYVVVNIDGTLHKVKVNVQNANS